MRRQLSRPTVLSIAGSDSIGGAGLQCDIKTIEALGAQATTAVTAVTAQNSRGVIDIWGVPSSTLRAQMDAVFDDAAVHAVKIGMLGDAETIETVSKVLQHRQASPIVCDPVLKASSGAILTPPQSHTALLEHLFPISTIVTPNVSEAETLSGHCIRTLDDARAAARTLLKKGPQAVLITGGHLETGRHCSDVLVAEDCAVQFDAPRIDSQNDHGTGCCLASSIATFLAYGLPLIDAVRAAKKMVQSAIERGTPMRSGRGSVNPLALHTVIFPSPLGRLHVITDESTQDRFSHAEIARLALAGGADTIQYREKRTLPMSTILNQARQVHEQTNEFNGTLIVNDRIDVSLALGAGHVHLGKTDMPIETARRLAGTTALIGTTANSMDEAIAANRSSADYIGVGPVYGTRSKAKPAATIGLDGLREIVRQVEKPVIAIGNISRQTLRQVMDTGVHGIAVLSAIAHCADPSVETAAFRHIIDTYTTDACSTDDRRVG